MLLFLNGKVGTGITFAFTLEVEVELGVFTFREASIGEL